jgi:hypothetical protein
MDNLTKLHNAVTAIYYASNKKDTNVGAMRGTMVSRDTVIIDGKTYHAVLGTQVNVYNGVQVWCQLSDSNTAVIIGA